MYGIEGSALLTATPPIAQSSLNHTRLIAAAIFAHLIILSPATPVRAGLIFDFEDQSFEGWETQGDLFIAQMGGVFQPGRHYALFGMDHASMTMTLDLTSIDRVEVDAFTPNFSLLNESLYIVARVPGSHTAALIATLVPIDRDGNPETIERDENPGILVASLAHLTGIHTVTIAWNGKTIPGGPAPTISYPTFVDRIAFRVPEAPLSSLLPLLVAGCAWIRRRRKVGGMNVQDGTRGASIGHPSISPSRRSRHGSNDYGED
jgi:hypothetical protein